jgi:two-component system invasion response regulator UvrY
MNVLIVDDHAVVRESLRHILIATLGQVEICATATGAEALALIGEHDFQLAILDWKLPQLGGPEILRQMRALAPQMPVLIFSMHTDPFYAAQALRAGARGYVSKSASLGELKDAILCVIRGEPYIENEITQALATQTSESVDAWLTLSARDVAILNLLTEGHSLGEIAATIGVSYKTVANVCTSIKARLGVSSTAELVRTVMIRGRIPAPAPKARATGRPKGRNRR